MTSARSPTHAAGSTWPTACSRRNWPPNAFLAGDTFTIADCAAAPGLFYALAIHPWDEGTHPQLTRYYRALAQRPSFAKVIADARPYRHLFPLPWPADFDRYH